MEKVEILSVTTKRKKIEVTGGFYSEEDMKTELGYKELSGCISENVQRRGHLLAFSFC